MSKDGSDIKKGGVPRNMLVIGGIVEIVLAFFLIFFWSEETGILYWIKDLIFTLLILSGILSLKDGLFASDRDILKKTSGGDRKDFELKKRNNYVEKLKEINDTYHVFSVAVILFFILYFTNIYIPGKDIVEGILLIIITVFGIPVLMFW
jgi:hypothetical protein